jgi:hypothetical protein
VCRCDPPASSRYWWWDAGFVVYALLLMLLRRDTLALAEMPQFVFPCGKTAACQRNECG